MKSQLLVPVQLDFPRHQQFDVLQLRTWRMAGCEIEHLECRKREILSEFQPHLMKLNTSSLCAKVGVRALALKFALQLSCTLSHEAARFVADFQPCGFHVLRGTRFIARTVASTD